MTPTRQQILELASELWRKDRLRANQPYDITPEESELRQEGFLIAAQQQLMYSESKRYSDYSDLELKENPKTQAFEFDVLEGLRSGTAIVGGRGTGKTNLAKLIAKEYIAKGYIVKVFDHSKAWLENTPIPSYIEVTPDTILDIPLYKSCVFDLSRLHVKTIKSFVAQVIAKEFELQVNAHVRKWIIYVFEDSVVSLPKNRLTSIEAEEILRLIAVGRNFNLGYLAVVQRPAIADTTVFELGNQKYIGRLTGENDKRKMRNYTKEDVQYLQIGEFLYDSKKISVPLFTQKTKPKRIETTTLKQSEPSLEPLATVALAILVFLLLYVLITVTFGK